MTPDRRDRAAGSDLSLDVAAVRARVDAATAGPWYLLYPGQCCEGGYCIEGQGTYGHNAAIVHAAEMDQRNVELIAHARTDVPALLAALEVAREREERVRAAVHEFHAEPTMGHNAVDDPRECWQCEQVLRALDGEQT